MTTMEKHQSSQIETETRMDGTETNDGHGVMKKEMEGSREGEDWGDGGGGEDEVVDDHGMDGPDRTLGIQGSEDGVAGDQTDARGGDSYRARVGMMKEQEMRAEGSPNIDQIIMQSFHKEKREQAPAKVWKTNNYNRVPNLSREQQNARLENNKHLNHFPSSLITVTAQSRAETRAEAARNSRSERAARIIRNNSQG